MNPLIKKKILFFLVVIIVMLCLFNIKKISAAEECRGTASITYQVCTCKPGSGGVEVCDCDDKTESVGCYFSSFDGVCSVTRHNDICNYSPYCTVNTGNRQTASTGCYTCENSCTPYCRGSWSSCSTSCGTGTQTQASWCTAECGNTIYGTSCSRACDSCSGCANTCTLCGATCPTNCGPNSTTGKYNCGVSACESDCTYNCACVPCNPSAPTLSTPANSSTFSNIPNINLIWNATSNWSYGCPNNNSYQLCVGTSADTCAYVNHNNGTNTSYLFSNGSSLTSLLPGTYYWRATANNGSRSANSSTYSFTVSQTAKTCTVTIPNPSEWENWNPNTPTVQVTVNGAAHASYGNNVRLFVERINGVQLLTNNIIPAANQYESSGTYYYDIVSAGCSSDMNSCTNTTTISLPTAGNYFFHCDIPQAPRRCSGNPFCSFETSTVYGESKPGPYPITCTDWETCNGATGDNLTVNDNVYYCAGAGEAQISFTNPSENEAVNITGVDYADISWSNSDQKADLYDFRIYDSNVYSSPNDVNCNDGNSVCEEEYGFYPWTDGGPTSAWTVGDVTAVCNKNWCWNWTNSTQTWSNPYNLSTHSAWASTCPSGATICPWTDGGPTAGYTGNYTNIFNGQWRWQWNGSSWSGPSDISTLAAWTPTCPSGATICPWTDGGPTSSWFRGDVATICNGRWCWQWNTTTQSWSGPGDISTSAAWTPTCPSGATICPWTNGGPTVGYTVGTITTVCNGGWCWQWNGSSWSGPSDISTNSYWLRTKSAPYISFEPPDDPNNPNRQYTVAVRAHNTTCNPYLDTFTSDWITRDFSVVADISGNIINDANNLATWNWNADSCSINENNINPLDGQFTNISMTASGPFGNISINRIANANGVINNDGTFTLRAPYRPSTWTNSDPYTLRLNAAIDTNLDQSQWYACSGCFSNAPGSFYRQANLFECTYNDVVYSPMHQDYPLTAVNLDYDAWFQAVGGNIAASTGINSHVPNDSCLGTNNCLPALITWQPWQGSIVNSPGFPLTETGIINTHKDGNSRALVHISSHRDQSDRGNAVTGNMLSQQPDYQYFYNKFGINYSDNIIGNLSMPTLNSGLNVFFHTPSGGLPAVLNNTMNWNIPSGTQVIVFIEGDLSIQDTRLDTGTITPITSVDPGGYLAFIVSGSIVVEPSVGNFFDNTVFPFAFALPSTITHLEGIFIADNYFNVASYGSAQADRKFIGEGTFVGWNGIHLDRDFDDTHFGKAWNALNPTETFIYRPDFLVNSPMVMKEPIHEWREVAPRTNN